MCMIAISGLVDGDFLPIWQYYFWGWSFSASEEMGEVPGGFEYNLHTPSFRFVTTSALQTFYMIDVCVYQWLLDCLVWWEAIYVICTDIVSVTMSNLWLVEYMDLDSEHRESMVLVVA